MADGAALLFNPYKEEEITRAMMDLILLPELAARMRRLGLQRATQFSWQNTAQRTLDVYYDVVERSQSTRRTPITASASPR